MIRRANWKAAAAVFLLTSVVLVLFHANRVVLTNDEGILLEPAQRMAAGARPYVDFFGYMSPGSYWLQALVFRWLGVSLWAGRLPVILDFSLQCALLYWLTARMASRGAAIAVVLTFAGFQIADPTLLTAQHRWDSATLALAGLCVAVAGRGPAPLWILSGGLLAAAAWCTPSMGLVVAVVGLWLAAAPARRKAVVPFLAGILAVTVAAIGGLAASGSLAAFVHQMAWLRNNYSSVNIMPYGSVIGGYGNLLKDTTGPVELAIRLVLVICLALPAILPLASVIAWGIALWRGKVSSEERPVVLLSLLAICGLVMTTVPRADVTHLAFITALPYALAAAALARFLPVRAGAALACAAILLAAIFATNDINGWRATGRLSSPVGELRVASSQLPGLERLLSQVRPGQSLFVYPYMPIHYFLTQATNPTRFSFLAPGMMTRREELETLGELQARPPQWLLYLQLSREEFMRVFPHGSALDWRFEILESWLHKNYLPVENPGVTVGGYQLWRRNPVETSTR